VGPPGEPFRGKRVLRALHERKFGAKLSRRKKQGFSIPVQKWLQGPFAGACERLFERKRLERFGILNSDELSDGRYRSWVNGREPHVAWYAFTLAAWCEATLGDGPDALRLLLHESSRAPSELAPADASVSPMTS
jgi:asparagine synthase (glutamine-hydrolysing)